jgi:YegS/Rv2252/BmrU family lipid kinase
MGNTFRTLVVFNPKAGSAMGARRRGALEEALRRTLPDVELTETSGPGDGTRRAREALRAGAEMIVSVGGDGTHHEVVNGFFEEDGAVVREGAVLAVLPGGTGGDFRKTLGYGKNPLELVALLGDRATRPCDVGRLAYVDHEGRPARRHFINIASFGLGGLVDDLVNKSTKAFGGFVSFAVGTVRAMTRFRAQRVRVRLDGGPERVRTISVVAVANGRWFGGGMQIAPGAVLDDGVFDVVTLPEQTLGEAMLRGHRVYLGTHVKLPGVIVERARTVEAEPFDPDEAVLLDVDGEAPGRLPATFEMREAAIRWKS